MTVHSEWRVECALKPSWRDAAGERWARECLYVMPETPIQVRTSKGYCFRAKTDSQEEVEHFAREILADPILHRVAVFRAEESITASFSIDQPSSSVRLDVVRRSGVMDPVADSIVRAAAALGIHVEGVRTYQTYYLSSESDHELTSIEIEALARDLFSNDVIEEFQVGGTDPIRPASPGENIPWEVGSVPLEGLSEVELIQLSRDHTLALNIEEMSAVRDHFREHKRPPTDLELETIAQTWSEHCKHKTLTGPVDMNGRRIDGILQSTVFKATQELALDWCLSVFKDNAGIIAFDDDYGLTFKVETHNHPSAIEPYGGAGTGIGGVIRDTLGTGLGAKPIVSSDVFCVGPPNLNLSDVPKGALHPRRVLFGVIRGVRDYGNRMGIPTSSGGVFFDRRYIGNPLVFCGNVGLIPRNRIEKAARPGDHIVVVGGRTGRDGIHGATFSSLELTEESETVSSGAVQIGNAIEEKKVQDVILLARDRELFSAITDCGAGGLSSAVGEMGEETGASVQLEKVPLKYDGLTYTEIWISEAQERMVLGVPDESLSELLKLCREEDVEATVIGSFTDDRRLKVTFHDQTVGDLEMHFLHKGVPKTARQATWLDTKEVPLEEPDDIDVEDVWLSLLAEPNISSKEWIIRQYDHEVLAGSAIKPLSGPHGDGPSDGTVILPRLGFRKGFAIGLGMNPCYGDLDPYRMALLAVDEAIRNVVCVGARPDRCAVLDNFAWGNCDKPGRLGSLVRAAEGCYEAAIAYGVPFISGKDSLNNEFQQGEQSTSVPPSLLISSIAIVDDISHAVSMDLKQAGTQLILVGWTKNELGGSHFSKVLNLTGGTVPLVDLQAAKRIHQSIHECIREGWILSCHDLSEGGLAVAVAEMAMAGRLGVSIDLESVPSPTHLSAIGRLFSESAPRYLIEVDSKNVNELSAKLDSTPFAILGEVTSSSFVEVAWNGMRRTRLDLAKITSAFKTKPWESRSI